MARVNYIPVDDRDAFVPFWEQGAFGAVLTSRFERVTGSVIDLVRSETGVKESVSAQFFVPYREGLHLFKSARLRDLFVKDANASTNEPIAFVVLSAPEAQHASDFGNIGE